MISTHFFGLFVAFSHVLIAILFLFYPNFKLDFLRLKYFLISGIISIVLFIPSIKASEIKNFWIQMPEKNAFESIYMEFFNNSKTVLFFLSVFGLLYIFSLSKLKQTSSKNQLINSKQVFSFAILFISIVCINYSFNKKLYISTYDY